MWEEKDVNFIRVDDSVWHVTDLARSRISSNSLDRKLKKYHVAILYVIMNLGGIADIDEISSETGVGAEKISGALLRLNTLGYVTEIASGRLLSDKEKSMIYGEKPVSPAKELTIDRQESGVAPSFVSNPEIPAKVSERVELSKTYGG